VTTVSAPNEPWLEGLTGKHKQYFDVAAHGKGAVLQRVANFLDAYNQAYGLADAEVNVVFGAHGTAIPLVLNDAVWARYKLGAHFSIDDSATKTPSERNLFSGVANGAGSFRPSIAALQKRGVRFLACMQAIARLSREIGARDGQDPEPINKVLLASLLPGVTTVPAAIVAVNRAQESGLTYVFVG
jgi:intracellular sulfur oxidation DsrE/DsrF family protein